MFKQVLVQTNTSENGLLKNVIGPICISRVINTSISRIFGGTFGIIDLDLFALAGLSQLSSTRLGNTKQRKRVLPDLPVSLPKGGKNWYFFTMFGYILRRISFMIIKKVH